VNQLNNPELFQKLITVLAFFYNACSVGHCQKAEDIFRSYGYNGVFLTHAEFQARKEASDAEKKIYYEKAIQTCQAKITSKLNELSKQSLSYEQYLKLKDTEDIQNLIHRMGHAYYHSTMAQRYERTSGGWNPYDEEVLKTLNYKGPLPSKSNENF